MIGFIIAIILLAFIALLKCCKIVQQAEVMIIERLGKFHKVLGPGINLVVPLIDNPRSIEWKVTQRDGSGHTYSFIASKSKIDTRECVYDLPKQNVITKDNVGISISALIYFQIIDAQKVAYNIQNLPEAIEKLTQSTLRNVIGEMALDEALNSRTQINTKLTETLDEAAHKWGAKINRVELLDIDPPVDVKTSMEKQMKAERDKRAAILEAEGKKQSEILRTEGERQAEINKAEGEKQAAILRAEGNAIARIREAQGESEAIEKIIAAIGSVGPADKYLIAMKYLETLGDIAAGENNKVVYMPYEATGILSSIDGIKEMMNMKK